MDNCFSRRTCQHVSTQNHCAFGALEIRFHITRRVFYYLNLKVSHMEFIELHVLYERENCRKIVNCRSSYEKGERYVKSGNISSSHVGKHHKTYTRVQCGGVDVFGF